MENTNNRVILIKENNITKVIINPNGNIDTPLLLVINK